MGTVNGQLRFSDFSPEGQVEMARGFRDLLDLVARISARRDRELAEMAAAGRRNEHIVIRRPEKEQGKERGDGRKKEDWQDRLPERDRDKNRRRANAGMAGPCTTSNQRIDGSDVGAGSRNFCRPQN